MALRRRTFLGAGLSTAIAGSTIACGGSKDGVSWRFFTAAEARTVDAICERLIPADEDPGAHDAGVVNYIDIQLTRHFRRNQKAYREGIVAVDAASRVKFGKPFVELTAEQQNEALIEIEEKSKPFFEMMLAHTRQGFYGDPRHGGNRNRVSWKMLALPFPPVRGRIRSDQPPQG